MSEKVGVAFYGAGPIVESRLAPGVQASEHCVPIGAFDVAGGVAANIAKLFDGKVYQSPEELLADPKVGMVSIATPHHLHGAQTREVLMADKHPWVEKPATCDHAEAKGLEELARSRNLGYWVDQMMKNNQLIQKAAEIVGSEGIGMPTAFRSKMRFSYYEDTWPGADKGFRNAKPDEQGGGPEWDVLIHLIYTALAITNSAGVDRISAYRGPQLHEDKPIMQDLTTIYQLDTGIVGTSSVSFIAPMAEGFDDLSFTIEGTQGRIDCYGALFQQSYTGQDDNNQRLIWYKAKDPAQTGFHKQLVTIPEGAKDIYAVEFDKFASSIISGQPIINTQALACVGVVQAAIRSAKGENQSEYVGDLFQDL